MAGWFDKYAKKSAAQAISGDRVTGGISRRRVLVGGSVAVASAWTAPVLLASSAAATVSCPAPNVLTTCVDASQKCCPPPVDRDPYTCGSATDTNCIPPRELGGTCGNQGQGVGGCNNGAQIKCNSMSNGKGCNYCRTPHVCGGEGAECGTNADCFGGGTTAICTDVGAKTAGEKFCRRLCTAPGGCGNTQNYSGGKQEICDTNTGYCAFPCSNDNQCDNAAGRCESTGADPQKFCQYDQ